MLCDKSCIFGCAVNDAVIGLSYNIPLDLIPGLEEFKHTLLDLTVSIITEVNRAGNEQDLLALGEGSDRIADALDRTGGNGNVLHVNRAENFGVFLLLHDVFKLAELCCVCSD